MIRNSQFVLLQDILFWVLTDEVSQLISATAAMRHNRTNIRSHNCCCCYVIPRIESNSLLRKLLSDWSTLSTHMNYKMGGHSYSTLKREMTDDPLISGVCNAMNFLQITSSNSLFLSLCDGRSRVHVKNVTFKSRFPRYMQKIYLKPSISALPNAFPTIYSISYHLVRWISRWLVWA